MKNTYTYFLSAFLLLLSGALIAQSNITFQVNMQNETVSADGVSVSYAPPGATGLGDVTIVALDDADGDGIYTGTSDVMHDTIGYFFINGMASNPLNFESVPEECGIAVSLLGLSAVIRPYIPSGDATLDAVCFAGCGSCAVTDCDNPAILVSDDASSYDLGDVGAQAHWGVWPGASLGVQVDTFESDNVFSMIGDPDNQDVLFFTGDRTSGHYRLAWIQYMPAGSNGFFNVQHQVPDVTAGYWAFDVFFDGDGEGILELNDDPGGTDTEYAFTYPEDEWFDVTLYIDLDNDLARLILNEVTISVWTFSDGVTNGGDEFDLLQLSGVNFYPIDESHVWYFDNIEFWEIPAAEEGLYCYTAVDIDPGVHTVADLSCYGGGLDLGGGDGAEKAAWFRYVPAEDGIVTISSCGGGVDTRGWILQGADCGNLSVVGVNDDMCDTGLDDDYASYREAVVTGGETYYIVWDNPWEAAGFDFELSFSTEDPTPGDFCQSAIAIEPGEHPLDEFTGNAAVAGPRINTFTSSTTPYSNSEWFSFTPTEAGSMTISSCDGAASDTYVFVYTGDCANFDGLTLVASSDDDCGDGVFTSLIEDYEVTVGETYLIEWIDRWSEDAFLWDLIFTPVVDVDEATLAQGLSIFPNPARDLLQVNIDLPEAADQLSLRLHNSLGAQILQRNLGSVSTVREELNLENLPAGIYWLELTNGKQQVTRKVVVQ